MNNRALLFILSAVGGITLALGAFFGWKYISNTTTLAPTINEGSGSLPVFPSVGGGSSVQINNGGVDGNEMAVQAPETPALYQVSSKPVSGYTTSKNGTELVARYVDRASGNIYESSLEHVSNKRITLTTLPKIQEALFTSSSTVVLRSVEENNVIQTLYGKVAATSSEELRPLLTSPLPQNITWVSTRGNNIFYLEKDEADGAAGFLTNIEKKTSSRIFSYPLSEWIPKLVEGNKVFLQTKASAYMTGGLFLLSNNSTNPAPLLLGGYGLAALPNDKGTKALISQTVGGLPQLSLLDVATKRLSSLPLGTFAEKCTWGSASSSVAYCMMPVSMENGIYPDEWYSGEKGTKDVLWKVDTVTGNLTLIDKLEDKEIDGIKLAVSAEDRYLLFINKKDLSLWSIRLQK